MNMIKQWLLGACLVLGVAFSAAALAGEPALDAAPVVNINSASAEELAEALNGVGLSRAQAIIESRDSEGAFQSAEDLARVKGVGPATVEKNRERIRLK